MAEDFKIFVGADENLADSEDLARLARKAKIEGFGLFHHYQGVCDLFDGQRGRGGLGKIEVRGGWTGTCVRRVVIEALDRGAEEEREDLRWCRDDHQDGGDEPGRVWGRRELLRGSLEEKHWKDRRLKIEVEEE